MARTKEMIAKTASTIKLKNDFYGMYNIPPCPFCGETENLIIEPSLYEKGKYVCKCRACFATTDAADTPEKAIQLWSNKEFPYGILITSSNYPYIDDYDVWLNLKNAIVYEAFTSYRRDLERALNCWNLGKAYRDARMKADVSESYFKRGEMRWLTEIAADVFIDTANKQARYNVMFRKRHECGSCNKTKCIHKRDDLWRFWDRGNEYDKCLKEEVT